MKQFSIIFLIWLSLVTVVLSKPLRVPVLAFPDDEMRLSELLDVSSLMITNHLFQGLFSFKNQNLLGSDLVESFSVSPNQLHYKFNLKKNIKFTNGIALTSKEVVDSIIETILSLKEASRWAFGNVIGFDNLIQEGNIDDFAFKAISKYTIIAKLHTVFNPFLYVFSTPYFRIKIKHNSYYIGTGPYVIKKRTSESILLEILYSQKHTTDVHQILFIKIQNKQNFIHKNKLKNFDITEILSNRPIYSDYHNVINFNFIQANLLMFNLNDSLFKTKYIRKQFYLCLKQNIDYNLFAWKKTHEGLPFIARLFQENDEIPDKWNNIDPIEIIFADSVSSFDQKGIDVLETLLNEKGIQVRFTRLNILDLLNRVKSKKYQAALISYLPDLISLESFFAPLVGTNQLYNLMDYSNKEVDLLIKRGLTHRSFISQYNTYNRLFDILIDEMPVGFLGTSQGMLLVSKEYTLPVSQINPLGLYMTNLYNLKKNKGESEN